MKTYKAFSIILSLFLLASCIKPEIIPSPSNKVVLPASFVGTLNGASYEIIKDLDGYHCKATQTKTILSTPQPSNIIYYSSLQSDSKIDYIQIGLGKLIFNADHSIDPSLESFTEFFNNNKNPDYSNGAENGVEIIFRDSDGKIWVTDEDTGMLYNFRFSTLSQESDETGDYMKFVAKFDAVLTLDVDINHPDYGSSIIFENAIFEAYFIR